jgi:tetrahydrodipicolinate N-succinyltransferase
MIAAAVDRSRPELEKLLFRDRSLRFWLPHFFQWCAFFPLPHASGGNFDFLFAFDLDKFPIPGESALRELRRWLTRQDSTKPWLYAPEKAPFFIASRAFLAKKKIALEPGLFRKLKACKEARPLPLAQALPVLHPESEWRRVEQAVVDLQVRALQKKGARVEDFGNFFMDGLAPVGKGTTIGSGVVIKGESRIGKDVRIYPNCFIENSLVGDRCLILPGSIIRDSRIASDVQLGPYCHLRNGTLVRQGAKIGNFVEMKKSVFGQNSKAMHLTYVGDARVGRKVNIGAGTITCNYDGTRKNPTVIEDNVFIGSGTELVAPVTVRRNSYVGAGSTITENVPSNALAIARQRQRNIPNWVLRKKKKKS